MPPNNEIPYRYPFRIGLWQYFRRGITQSENVPEKGVRPFLVFVALAALLALQLLVGRELVGAGHVLPVALRVPERRTNDEDKSYPLRELTTYKRCWYSGGHSCLPCS